MTETTRFRAFRHLSVPFAALLALLAAAPAAASHEDDAGYGYFRIVEGISNLTTLDEGEPLEIEPNYPVMVGDRVWVTLGARLELVLPDKSLVRAMGGTDLFVERLALAADGDPGDSTELRLLTGEIQFVLFNSAAGLAPPRIETEGATVFLQSPGEYRITAEEDGWTEVVVRKGFAEVETDRGSAVVRSGEEARVESYGRVSIATAGRLDSLEVWASELDSYAVAGESRRYVDESLAYAAAPLDRHGSWVAIEGRYAWRPRVINSWRPYVHGTWVSTPSGLTWVSAEPWGWVTSHYGLWDFYPSYGWVWYPGRYYSPAWVYWYWGPTHVAWIPAGYYANFYGPRWGFSFGFRHGVFGWAGGHWSYWDYWTFCPVRYFGHRSYNAYWRSGRELGRFGTLHAVPRGIVTTDTRPIHRNAWGKPSEIHDALKRDLHARRRDAVPMEKLADVTEFIARRPQVSPEARSAILADRAPDGRGDAGARSRSLEARPWVAEPPRARSERLSTVGASPRAVGSTLPRLSGPRAVPESRSIEERRGAVPADPRSRVVAPGALDKGPERRAPEAGRFTSRLEAGLPPSPRAVAPRRVGDPPPRFTTPDNRPPVARRVVDGIRSQTGQRPESIRREPPPSSRSGAVSRPTPSRPPESSARGGSSSRPDSSSARSSSSSSSRSSGSSARSSRGSSRPDSSSARSSGRSRSSGSSARSSSPSRGSGNRSAARSRPKPKPKPN